MKRFMLPTVLLAIAVFVMPAYADPEPKEVVVVNVPDAPFPVQGEVEVTNQVSVTGGVEVTNTPLDVYVTSAEECRKKVTSAYLDIPAENKNELVTIITVAADEVFVLTDIAFTKVANNRTAFVTLLENETIKGSFRFTHYNGTTYFPDLSSSPTLHFNAGISFAPSSNVVLDTESTWGKFFFAGYTTNCF